MKEAQYYKCIKERIRSLFGTKVHNVNLEITSKGTFTQQLKQRVPRDRDIIFHFLGKRTAPDIAGFVQRDSSTDFIIIEVKKNLKVGDIYQTMMYRDFFNSKYTFLVTLEPIPEEIKRLCRVTWILHNPSDVHAFLVLTQFERSSSSFVEWYEENPFEKELYWR